VDIFLIEAVGVIAEKKKKRDEKESSWKFGLVVLH